MDMELDIYFNYLLFKVGGKVEVAAQGYELDSNQYGYRAELGEEEVQMRRL
jgi:hypothetical protein